MGESCGLGELVGKNFFAVKIGKAILGHALVVEPRINLVGIRKVMNGEAREYLSGKIPRGRPLGSRGIQWGDGSGPEVVAGETSPGKSLYLACSDGSSGQIWSENHVCDPMED